MHRNGVKSRVGLVGQRQGNKATEDMFKSVCACVCGEEACGVDTACMC